MLKSPKTNTLFETIKRSTADQLLKLLSYFWIIVNLLCYLLILFRIFYLPSAQSLRQHWSFIYNDQPWTPSGIKAIPIIGNHYFGDFQLGLLYSSLENPYQGNLLLPYGYPPVVHQILKPISKLDLQVAFLGYLLMIILILYWFVNLLSRELGENRNRFKLISLLICGLSTPLAVALDRGNFVIFSITFATIAVYLGLSNKRIISNQQFIAAILLAAAINLKAYVAVIVILMICLRKIRFAFLSVIFTLLPNILLSFMYPGSFLQVTRKFIQSLFYYSENPDPYFALSGNSQIAGIGRFMEVILNMNPHEFVVNINSFNLLLGMIWLGLTIFLVMDKEMPTNLRIIIILSNLQFFSPVSMFYTGIWSMFSLLLLLQYLILKRNSSIRNWNLYVLLMSLCAIIAIAPNPTRFYFVSTSIPWMCTIYSLALAKLVKLAPNLTGGIK